MNLTNDKLGPITAVEVRLHSLMGMAYSGNRIGTWGYSPNSRQLFFPRLSMRKSSKNSSGSAAVLITPSALHGISKSPFS